MTRLIPTLLLLISVNISAQVTGFYKPQGALENPSPGSYASGIYMFSGWACNAGRIEIVINDRIVLEAGYGTNRDDTVVVCGDRDNGFGLLYNMSSLGTGAHTAVAYADDQKIGESTFFVQKLSTGEFLRGTQGLSIANNFPAAGRESWLTWVQSAQNYAIENEQASVDPFEVAGIWYDDSENRVINVSTSRIYADRTEAYVTMMGSDTFGDAANQGFYGYLEGKTAKLISVLPDTFESEATVTFTDPLNAIIKIDSCVSFDPRLSCLYDAGAKVSIRKRFGANTATPALQDGTPLVPIGGLGQDDLFGE